jgi:hypothetical protein
MRHLDSCREGFFDQFRVTFDRRAGVFELHPYAADVH